MEKTGGSAFYELFFTFFLRMAFLNQATTLIRLKEALLDQIVFFFDNCLLRVDLSLIEVKTVTI